MNTEERATKTREDRLRRMAKRQRMRLEKSPRRDVYAWDYGTYRLVAIDEGVIYQAHPTDKGGGYGLNLDDIEHLLTSRKDAEAWTARS